MTDANAETPEFEASERFFKVVLFPIESGKKKSDEGLNEGLKSLLKTINENPGVQAKDLSKSLSRPIKTVEMQIKTLTDKNLIERRWSKKTGGYWVL